MTEHTDRKDRHGKYFFYFCLAASLLMVFFLWKPFIKTIIFSLICAATVFPVHKRLVKFFKNRSAIASITTCLCLVILIIVPLTVLAYFFVQEATGIYTRLSAATISEIRKTQLEPTPAESIGNAIQLVVPGVIKSQEKQKPKHRLSDKITRYARQLIPMIQKSRGSVEAQAMDLAKAGLSFAAKHAQKVISNVTSILLNFFLFLFTVFFFLKDGPAWLKALSEVIPLSQRQKGLIISRFKDVSMSTVFGILLTATLQGLIAGIGFWIVGLSPVLLGTTAAFAALIPIVGASLVWIPAGIYLIADGSLKTGIFLLVWGATLISFLDNFYRPFLMRGTTEVSAVWILFSVLGGLSLLGFAGIFIGPLILSMAITMISIYRDEYSAKQD